MGKNIKKRNNNIDCIVLGSAFHIHTGQLMSSQKHAEMRKLNVEKAINFKVETVTRHSINNRFKETFVLLPGINGKMKGFNET